MDAAAFERALVRGRQGLSRRWRYSAAATWLHGVQAGAGQRIGGPPPVRLLIVTDGSSYTSEQQIAPLMRHAGGLRRAAGLVLRRMPLDQALATPKLPDCDALGLKLGFDTPRQTAAQIARQLRHTLPRGRPLIYFDGDDDLGVVFPEVLAECDVWLKKHVFAEPERYLEPRIGKANLTDHVAKLGKADFTNDITPSSDGLDPALVPRISLGWNIAFDDVIATLAARPRIERPRDIDISCRAMIPDGSWIEALRGPAIEAIRALDERYKVHAPETRVPQAVYYDEMLRSRISVSPFGFGEICWRDFEVMLCGALLIKPDMGHLRTAPDLFRPHETYVPCAWDFSDLGEICDRYLSDPAAAEAIASRAERELRRCLEGDATVELLLSALRRAGLPIGAA